MLRNLLISIFHHGPAYLFCFASIILLSGADGIAAIIQNDPRGSSALGVDWGKDLGYGGVDSITPSVDIEFGT